MGQSKKLGYSGSQVAAIWWTRVNMYYYMYGRRILLYGLLVIFAFFVGWYLHRKGYFADVRLSP